LPSLLKVLIRRALRREVATVAGRDGVDADLLLEINALIEQGALDAAEKELGRLAATADNCDVAMLNGRLALRRGDSGGAIAHFERATTLSPRLGAAHAQLGALHAAGGQFERAIESYQSALVAQPESAGLYNNLGIIYLDLGQLDDARQCLESAVRLDPAFAAARNNLGRVWRELRDYAAALECFRAASGEFDARVNAGLVLNDLGEHAEASKVLLACAREQPNHVATQCGLGFAVLGLAQFADAEDHFRAVLALDAENPEACFGLANIALLRGEFAYGWRLYEARMRLPKFLRYYQGESTRWQGDPMPGRTLLVYSEQGFGDILLFARFMRLLPARVCGTVVFRCRPSLARLFADFPGIDRVISDESAMAVAHDAEIALLSLAHVMDIAREGVPGAMPYLRASNALAARWRERVAHDRRARVGLVWGGNPVRVGEGSRVPEAEAFQALSAVNDVTFYNLQVGFSQAELGRVPLALIDYTAELTDFADTAALIENLDLVISVDTSVAHLAGAMGKPTWLLHSGAPDWRWVIAGVESPWYPSVRVFRRHREGWASTLAEVAVALGEFAGERHRQRQRERSGIAG
jgi:tetratricopeptide (TPR) repeat protein